ncbi:hypothetical protein EVG20_g2293 [Dentipellis fragilis]|uniref:Phosphatidyl-N-methylethanolamine N-methyltransferase n=1 Tax=Dentipellis fragilis TaxID=205917 RepID=A0A4Y9Z8F4_9AGAM|nr:hypothetical protein EVG20_g2293 [Dentipellis fragilis]
MDTLYALVDTSKSSLILSIAAIAFNPTAWNIVARNEYRNKTITRLFGSPRVGCYFLALCIFGAGMLRDHLFQQALQEQPRIPMLPELYRPIVAASLFLTGQLFVVTSTWQLGVTGTFLGDYFGILMDHRVEGFPFNVLRDPMYVGSTMCFAATALWWVLSLHVNSSYLHGVIASKLVRLGRYDDMQVAIIVCPSMGSAAKHAQTGPIRLPPWRWSGTL